ncbi:MAG: RluA family pseudouridine synthase [Agathobacter sp.]|nr:RluA family pseudouridine synthase [Agathobacter sp.]
MKKIEIIFEDKDILVCRKPAGVATQTKRLGQQDMESLLKNYRAKKGEEPYIGIVHRLDQPVEGVMVFAKNQKAAANLSKQVQDRVIGKYYYAVSAKAPKESKARLEDYLLTDKKSNYTQVVDDKTDGAKEAKLEYKVMEAKENQTLFDIKLHTGRQHQIRVQMANAGCPLVGDSKYGEMADKEQLALCSYKLEFEHPTKKIPMKFEIQPIGKVFVEFFL